MFQFQMYPLASKNFNEVIGDRPIQHKRMDFNHSFFLFTINKYHRIDWQHHWQISVTKTTEGIEGQKQI